MLKFDGVTIPAVVSVACGLRSEWDAIRGIIDGGILIIETDTCSIKLTNGIHTYAELPYLRVENISAEMKYALSNQMGNDEHTGYGAKALLLDSAGKIDPDKFYYYGDTWRGHKGALVFVEDINARDMFPGVRQQYIYYVKDATDDPSVSSGSAIYVFYMEDTSNSGPNDKWVKIAEFESIDIDINTHIHKTYGSIDEVSDGTNHVRISKSDHDQFLDLKNTSVVTGTNKVYLVNSLTETDFMSTP